MATPDPRDLRVLVVEDNLDNRMIVCNLLKRKCGVRQCLEASAGWQAFKQLHEQPRAQPLDLILLDLHIPGEDGYGVLRRIRSIPALRGIPVIAVTASVLPQDVERCQAAGFDGFIGKPISPTRFPEQIGRILRGEPVWEPR